MRRRREGSSRRSRDRGEQRAGGAVEICRKRPGARARESCHMPPCTTRLIGAMDDRELRKSLAELHSASFAWARTCCRSRELAEEVLQSVYVRVLDGRAPYAGRSSFRTWLFAVIRNAARDELRKGWWSRVLRLEVEALAQAAGPARSDFAGGLEQDELARIRGAIERLPTRQRQVAHLVFYEDLSIAGAAEVMSVSVGTARRHYARAKKSLRTLLEPLWNRRNESILR